jgi:CO dehydrogenase maturation factor
VRAVDDEIQRAIVEADGFDLVTMGRPEGPRCYCYVNGLLRRSLDSLARGYEAVVLDNEAGMEHLSRRTTNNVDVLVAVMDATLPALRAARRIVELSRQLPVSIARRAVLVNRVTPAGIPGAASDALAELAAADDVDRLPDVPQDDSAERAGAEGATVFDLDAESPALRAVEMFVARLGALKGAHEGQ